MKIVQTAVLFLALLPAVTFGSVVYTFDQKALSGDYGFSLTAPDYLNIQPGTNYSFTANLLSSCDLSANPIYVCQGGNFTVFQNGYVAIFFGFMDPNGTGFGATNSVTAEFAPFSFSTSGTYTAFDGGATGLGATLNIMNQNDPAPAPEPGTVGSLLAGFGLLGVYWRRRHR